MTKSELSEILAQRLNLTNKMAKMIVETVIESLKEALLKDERIEIRGFGSIVNRRYKGYTGRNPKTGKTIKVPTKILPFFKVGKELKKRVSSS
ncbi:MAG: integration host factor subunit beta [Deltaproteobacteria bacterium]|nr:integration host factor subunit beta [Deltaproteobacteria bacterium]